jgi:hypothetical protein
LDGGDFYICFMYFVFLGFFLRLILKLWNGEKQDWFFLSLKWVYSTFVAITTLFFKFLCKKVGNY